MKTGGPSRGVSERGLPLDLRTRLLAEPGAAGILRALASSTGLTVALEEVSPAFDGHGPPCRRMRRLGHRRIQECVDRRAGLLGHVAGTGTSASIRCPVGTYCLAVPVYAQGFHVVTIRAGGFTRKMGASKARADAIRELLLLASDELGRRAAAMIAHPLSGNAAVRRAMDHIHAHSNEPVRIQDIAAEVGVSRQHLVKIWKQHVGLTLHSCLQAIRIDHAKALLETDGHKIIEVAMACGFGSLSQFNRTFLRVTGVSPSRWINQVR